MKALTLHVRKEATPLRVRQLGEQYGEASRWFDPHIEATTFLFMDWVVPTGITLSFVVTILLLVAGHRGSRVTDFLAAGQKTVRGWPVAVAFDRTGALVIADEVGNTVWRVSGAAAR